MSLEELRRDWEDWGEIDPEWAVASRRRKQHGQWGLDDFFRVGEEQVGRTLAVAAELGLPRSFGSALDFGCGVGRASRALAGRFERVCGVDIADSMIRRARELNAAIPQCEFVVNAGESLGMVPDGAFDFAYCHLVLQHVPGERLILGYVGELLRVVKPEAGLLYFQLPSATRAWPHLKSRARHHLYRLVTSLGVDKQFSYQTLKLQPMMQMHAIPEARVRAEIERRGGCVLRVLSEPRRAGTMTLTSSRYFVAR